ncbi:MAG: serine hydrolase domain-containing protein [Chloroflexota bacterium]
MKIYPKPFLLLGIAFSLFLFAGCRAEMPLPTPASPAETNVPATTGGVTASPVSSAQPHVQAAPWPTDEWATASPESQGMDGDRLDEMLQAAEGLGLHSLLIVRNGFIVSETYYPPYTAETRHDMYSVTKSFVATLVGIAVDKGLFSVDNPVMDFFPERTFDNLNARKQAMQVEDLLSMASGLNWQEGDPTYQAMYRSADWVKYVMDQPMAADPGERFLYCSGCSHVLSAIVQTASGENTRQFAQENLFDPLGIRANWETDSQGIPIGGWGLQITPRDMARLGYLYLHEGTWDGRQIVSSQWIKAATQQHADNGDGGYGFQWWLHPDLGGYSALGRYGQTIFVQPELDLVVVTTARLDGHGPIFNLIDRYILPAAR